MVKMEKKRTCTDCCHIFWPYSRLCFHHFFYFIYWLCSWHFDFFPQNVWWKINSTSNFFSWVALILLERGRGCALIGIRMKFCEDWWWQFLSRLFDWYALVAPIRASEGNENVLNSHFPSWGDITDKLQRLLCYKLLRWCTVTPCLVP